MELSAQQKKLQAFGYEWKHWTWRDDFQQYEAWSTPQQTNRLFCIEELNAIDPRIIPTLDYPDWPDSPGDMLHARLSNSIFLWIHPERVVPSPHGVIYWQSIVSIEDFGNDGIEIMFEAPLDVKKLHNGTLIASSITGNPSRTLSWGQWEEHLPGIEKYYSIAKAMDMDRYASGEYCESMLFKDPPNADLPKIMLPEDLSPNN